MPLNKASYCPGAWIACLDDWWKQRGSLVLGPCTPQVTQDATSGGDLLWGNLDGRSFPGRERPSIFICGYPGRGDGMKLNLGRMGEVIYNLLPVREKEES